VSSPPDSYIPPEDAGFELAESIQERGNFGYTVAGMLGRPRAGRGPLGMAAFLALPLFFCSLMASTLALEKADKFQFKGPKCHPVCTIWHPPATSTEVKIWLWALVPSVVLVLVGWIATRLPLGFYVSCVAAIVVAMGVAHKTATWEKHHIARFPTGIDLIPDKGYAFSNQFNRGEWEKSALSTALSFEHWTIGIALAGILVMGGLWLRARRHARRPGIVGMPHEGIHAPDATQPGL